MVEQRDSIPRLLASAVIALGLYAADIAVQREGTAQRCRIAAALSLGAVPGKAREIVPQNLTHSGYTA